MKAVVKYDMGDGCTDVREMPIPAIGDEDVLVKVAYCGICGTDPHMHHNKVSFAVNVPLILGHEFSGMIEKVGSKVTGFQAGDRVTAETHAEYCGKCILCRTKKYHLCRERKGYGFGVNGAFASYVKAPARILHKVPEGVTLREAALTEPLCVAYNALVNFSTIKPGDYVVVIGPGPIGLLCAKMASILGAGEVVVIGTAGDEKRLEFAKKFGAKKVLSGTEEECVKEILSCGDGYGADLVVDTAGVSSTLHLSLEAVRPLGQITKIGWGPAPVGFSLDKIISKAVTLRGTFSHTWDVWEKSLVLMDKKMVNIEELVTHTLPLDRWEEGFHLIESREGIKVILTPIE